MAPWLQVVVGAAAFVTAVGVIWRSAIRPLARGVSLMDEFLPLMAGDEHSSPPVLPLRERLVRIEGRAEDAYREARAAKEASVAVLSALRRKGVDL